VRLPTFVAILSKHRFVRITFKRKQKESSRFSLSNLFSTENRTSLPLQSHRTHLPHPHDELLRDIPVSANPHSQSDQNGGLDGNKIGGPHDSYVEGPGRRLGYDNLTAIDWIFEYTKERQRIRYLYSSSQGLLGHVRQLLDAGHVWLVLITTGIAVGILAACIDIASNWLGNIKTGYCRSGEEGGRFYLNKSFCCWGYEGMYNQVICANILLTNEIRFIAMSPLDTMEKCTSGQIRGRGLRCRIHIFCVVFCMYASFS
jgi:chloride channel 3/4/5